MFGKRFTLFKLFGFEVKMDLSWLILGMLITWSLARGVFPNMQSGLSPAVYWLMGVVGAIGLLLSIVFHELWHSLVARRFGIPMKGITLFIFGGIAEMDDEPPSPKAEFFMAVAGPLSSIVLAGLLFAGFLGGIVLDFPKSVTSVIQYLAFLNLILAVFNMLPAFPLDGGRVLRSVIWGYKNDIKRATQIASRIGAVFGIALMIFGAVEMLMGQFIGGVWMLLIGMFLRMESKMSLRHLVIRDSLKGVPVKDIMISDPVTVSPEVTIETLVEDFVYKHHFKLFPVVESGRLVGCVTIDRIKQVPRQERAEKTVGDILQPCAKGNTISPDDDSMEILSRMGRSKISRMMVAEDDRLVGVVSLKDILNLMSLKQDLDS